MYTTTVFYFTDFSEGSKVAVKLKHFWSREIELYSIPGTDQDRRILIKTLARLISMIGKLIHLNGNVQNK